jgi:hypothetical protein
MTARACLFWLSLSVASSAAVGCGGSSSETPPPLPPHPLNEPYRVRGAIIASESEAAKAEAPEEERPLAPNAGPANGRSTWGTSMPEALPELAPR